MLYYDTFPTPAGPFSAAVNEAGILIATAFGDVAALRGRLQKARLPDDDLQQSPRRLARVRKQVAAYFAPRRRGDGGFDLPLDFGRSATPFQRRVWAALPAIPPGSTTTYGELAARLGGSPRAVGRAAGANPLCLVVPCHRVIGKSGSLTGFAFGLECKRWLLEHEAGWRESAFPPTKGKKSLFRIATHRGNP